MKVGDQVHRTIALLLPTTTWLYCGPGYQLAAPLLVYHIFHDSQHRLITRVKSTKHGVDAHVLMTHM
jgi:hypothetical protein